MKRLLRLAALLLPAALVGGVSAAPPPPGGNAMDQVLRIALAKSDFRLILKIKGPRALAPACTEAELDEIVGLHEKLGEPEGGVKVYEARVAKFPGELHPREQLAKLLDRMGKSKDAIPVWAGIEAKFGLTPQQAVLYAVVLERHERSAEALAVLQRVEKKAKDDNETFWLSYGMLAWKEDHASALRAYELLGKMKSTAHGVAQRLYTLLAEAGRKREAIDVALAAFAAEKLPAHWSFAVSLLEELSDWEGLQKAIKIAEAASPVLDGREEYWVLRGDVYAHFGDKDKARKSYWKALEINPHSVPARGALLWDAIERDDRKLLRTWVQKWYGEAQNEASFYAPFAVALDHLGFVKQAIGFYERQLHLTPNDYLWLLEYADALEKIGQPMKADQLRRAAFGPLRKDVLAGKADPKLKEQHAHLAKKLEGTPAGEKWLELLLGKKLPKDDETRELLVAWYLEDDRLDRAKRVLVLSHAERIKRPAFKGFRMILAIEEGDRGEIEHLLESPTGLTTEEKRLGAQALDRDDLEIEAASEHLDKHDDETAPPVRRSLRELRDRHVPHVTAGVQLTALDVLQIAGPLATVTFDAGRYRVGLHGSYQQAQLVPGGRFYLPTLDPNFSSVPLLPSTVAVIDAHAFAREFTPTRVTEVALGLSYLGRLLPRAELTDVRAFGDRTFSHVRLGLFDLIEDSAFLRLAGVRHVADLQLRQDLPLGFFTALEVKGMLDTDRKLAWLGSEVGASLDLGYRLLHDKPEWLVGVRGLTHHRLNPDALPVYAAGFAVDPREDKPGLLPPERFHLVSFVMQISRGDFLARAKSEEAAFPRYDCDGGIGYQWSSPASDLNPGASPAGHLKCAVSLRVPTGGYLTGLVFYAYGLSGRNASVVTNASLTYTQML